jgi:hypothetical protein
MHRRLSNVLLVGLFAILPAPAPALADPPPPPYVYALLSRLAYEPKSDSEIQELNRLGWYWMSDSFSAGINHHDGYYGLAYINGETCQLIVAHRGTDQKDWRDIFRTHGDIDDDLSLLIGKHPPAQFKNSVVPFIQMLQTMMESHDCRDEYTMSFTGHSLGAALAELSVTYNASFTAVTFDSPGVESVKDADSRIVSYLAAPNFINTAKAHVGKRILIDLDWQVLRQEYYSRIRWPLDYVKRYIDYSIEAHSMRRILEAFGSGTAQTAHPGAEVNWWPCGWLQSFLHFLSPQRYRLMAETARYVASHILEAPFNVPHMGDFSQADLNQLLLQNGMSVNDLPAASAFWIATTCEGDNRCYIHAATACVREDGALNLECVNEIANAA